MAGRCGSRINTFVAFDLETTGLPSLENYKTKITELALVAASTENILAISSGLPRVMHKFTLCVNPFRLIHPDVTGVTGLSNDMLEKEKSFDEDACKMLNLFLSRQIAPVCLIAHNGMNFDFPIIQSEIMRVKQALSDEVLCVDSYTAFRDILSNIPLEMLPYYEQKRRTKLETQVERNSKMNENSSENCNEIYLAEDRNFMRQINERTPEQNKVDVAPPNVLKMVKAKRRLFTEQRYESQPQLNSFKLKDIYEFLYGRKPINIHRAENDAETLMECITFMGQHFVDWANVKAEPLNKIKAKNSFLR